MAYGFKEDPALSVGAHLESVDFPATREQLSRAAMDNGGPVDLINVFKSLPRERYESQEAVLRDLAEASRRFAMGGLPARGPPPPGRSDSRSITNNMTT